MTLQDQLEKILKDFEKIEPEANPLVKSIVAYVELQRYDHLQEAILNKDRFTLLLFSQHPGFESIITNYLNNVLDEQATLEQLQKSKDFAENYFRQRGYNPDVEKQYFENLHNERQAKAEQSRQALERAEELLRKYEK